MTPVEPGIRDLAKSEPVLYLQRYTAPIMIDKIKMITRNAPFEIRVLLNSTRDISTN